MSEERRYTDELMAALCVALVKRSEDFMNDAEGETADGDRYSYAYFDADLFRSVFKECVRALNDDQ